MSDSLREVFADAHAVAGSDPNVALFKLRWCGEVIAKELGSRSSIEWPQGLRFELFIDELLNRGAIDSDTAAKLDKARVIGNRAVHEMSCTSAEAQIVLACIADLAKIAFPTTELSVSRFGIRPMPSKKQTSMGDVVSRMHTSGNAGRKHYQPRLIRPKGQLWSGFLAIVVIVIAFSSLVSWTYSGLTPAEIKQRFDIAFALGDSKRSAGSFAEAEEHYKSAISLIPTSGLAHRYLGETLIHLDRYQEAERELQEAMKLGATGSGTLHQYGMALFAQKRYDAAMKIYEDIIATDPSFCAVYLSLAVLEVDTGRYGSAIYHLSDRWVCRESKLDVLSVRASAFAALRQWDMAVEDLSSLVEARPDDPDLRDRLAEAHSGMGEAEVSRDQRAIADRIRKRRITGVKSFLTWLFN